MYFDNNLLRTCQARLLILKGFQDGFKPSISNLDVGAWKELAQLEKLGQNRNISVQGFVGFFCVISSNNSKLNTMRSPTFKIRNATPVEGISTLFDKVGVAFDIPVIGCSKVLGNLRKFLE